MYLHTHYRFCYFRFYCIVRRRCCSFIKRYRVLLYILYNKSNHRNNNLTCWNIIFLIRIICYCLLQYIVRSSKKKNYYTLLFIMNFQLILPWGTHQIITLSLRTASEHTHANERTYTRTHANERP